MFVTPVGPSDRPIQMGVGPMLISVACFFAIGLIAASSAVAIAAGRIPAYFSLIPILGALAFFAPTKLVRGKARQMIPAFVVQAGLVTVMVIWMLFTRAGGRGWVECLVLGVGTALLIGIQQWWPALPLGLYQLWAAFVALRALPSVPQGTGVRTLVLTILVFRLLAVLTMAMGIVRYLQSDKSAAAQAIAPATAETATASRSGGSHTDQTVEELRRLAALAKEGVITQEEFAAGKRRILGI